MPYNIDARVVERAFTLGDSPAHGTSACPAHGWTKRWRRESHPDDCPL